MQARNVLFRSHLYIFFFIFCVIIHDCQLPRSTESMHVGEDGAWAYPGTAQIFWVPPIISGTGKATDFKFCRNIRRVDWNKSQIFREPICRAQCAVIFAIAQLSCVTCTQGRLSLSTDGECHMVNFWGMNKKV